MEIKINITENNCNVLESQYRMFNLTNDTNLSLDSFKELVFINGLLSMANGVEVRSKRNAFGGYDVRRGEIIEYR